MTRAERKEARQIRVKTIKDSIAQIMADAVKEGKTVAEAVKRADDWAQQQLKEEPQRKQDYVDAALLFARELKQRQEVA